MPSAFPFNASPFDCLTPDEQRLVRASVDIAYFPEGAVVLDAGSVPSHLFVIIKGYVTQTEGEEVLATYGPEDSFDGCGLMTGRLHSRFVATEELVAYQLAREAVNELIACNTTFGALLFSDLGQKLSALARRAGQHELQSLTMARVEQAFLRPAPMVTADTDIITVVRLLQEQRVKNVLVTGLADGGLGIFTNTDLQRAILDGRPLDQLAVGTLASTPVVTVRESDSLGDAMVLLLRRRVHRLVVLEDAGAVRGVLEALDLFSFLANHSHVITAQIEHAQDLPALAQAAAQITRLLAALQRGGTRIGLMAKLVQQLNAHLFERAWSMVAPPDLVENSCLFVMGSEGRGEQLLKTDQDNGLVLRDGYAAPPELDAICQRFSEVLASFGYPECPGRIMVSNPDWRGSVHSFGQRVRQWLLAPEADSLMQLAIFLDAHAVAGDAALLHAVREGVVEQAIDNDAVLARFAAAIDNFGGASGWWSRLFGLSDEGRAISLKKAGIFPIVHGVRSLALARRVPATGTAERIAALVEAGVLDAALGDELVQSLHFLMGLRLQAGLAQIDTGRPVTGNVDPERLSTLERDLLKDALAVVKRFKALLHHRLKLDAL
ncbi:CBS domain-containing protein [Acidovorax sp. 210-6]|uniref:putative nucleotidyltransferase substrate binding domain-containing protein n=1 Tax=Acidovorax sp. 210-6 TaxID=2699468 RepID=UPI001389D4ED|nr:putative nucleotidyltransferase substrate binding domain-containing protein [Acidovorax sp. 210-6]NCU64856.1 CBS domain-containing protein [Acidovorax sp. 210-6]